MLVGEEGDVTMSDVGELQAAERETGHKGAAREIRRNGRVPGIVYGGGKEAIPISIEEAVLSYERRRGGFFSRLYSLDVGGKTYSVLAREVQVDPVTEALIHIDFLRLTADSTVNVDVSVAPGNGAVVIGNNTHVGSNSIIESNVRIGENCVIGSFVILKNSLINTNVHIKDGAKIGIKGFGFIPIKQKNLRTPQIGKVVLEEGVEIGSNCTIDRGSVTDTIVGKNTFLDNQVHLAHNVKIGENCMIAGQVGIAGSTIVGNNVMIGGQAGVSGHLKIGNNVKIGGGSGVINDIPDNHQVMGYPAVPLKDFIKQRKK